MATRGGRALRPGAGGEDQDHPRPAFAAWRMRFEAVRNGSLYRSVCLYARRATWVYVNADTTKNPYDL